MPTAVLEAEPARKPPVQVRQTKMLIDGKWVDSVSGKTFETINPATGEQTLLARGHGDYVNPRGVAIVRAAQARQRGN